MKRIAIVGTAVIFLASGMARASTYVFVAAPNSVATALDAITDASSSNPYTVVVGPGEFVETELVQVKSFVHLMGSGPNATIIESSRSASSQTPDAATVEIDDEGRISDLTVRNVGTSSTYAIGIHTSQATRDTVIDNVVVEVDGDGGVAHFAAYLNDSEPTIRNSVLRASGAFSSSAVNTAVGIVNNDGGFPQPLIQDSILNGGNGNVKTCTGDTGTGFGIQASNGAPEVVGSTVCGDHRSIVAYVAGIHRVTESQLKVSATTGAFMVETTGSAAVTVAASGVFHAGNAETGLGNGVSCVLSYKPTFATEANADCL